VCARLQQSGIQIGRGGGQTLLEWEAGFAIRRRGSSPFISLPRLTGLIFQPGPEFVRSAFSSAGYSRATSAGHRSVRYNSADCAGCRSAGSTFEQQQINSQLTAFAKDHPHFEAVKVKMGQLMQAGLASDLESAYQQAIAITPEISDQIRAEANARKLKNWPQPMPRRHARPQAAVSPGPPSQRARRQEPQQPAKKGASARESILSSVKQLREEQRA
jgi:hypothetical protein